MTVGQTDQYRLFLERFCCARSYDDSMRTYTHTHTHTNGIIKMMDSPNIYNFFLLNVAGYGLLADKNGDNAGDLAEIDARKDLTIPPG